MGIKSSKRSGSTSTLQMDGDTKSMSSDSSSVLDNIDEVDGGVFSKRSNQVKPESQSKDESRNCARKPTESVYRSNATLILKTPQNPGCAECKPVCITPPFKEGPLADMMSKPSAQTPFKKEMSAEPLIKKAPQAPKKSKSPLKHIANNTVGRKSPNKSDPKQMKAKKAKNKDIGTQKSPSPKKKTNIVAKDGINEQKHGLPTIIFFMFVWIIYLFFKRK